MAPSSLSSVGKEERMREGQPAEEERVAQRNEIRTVAAMEKVKREREGKKKKKYGSTL